MPAKDRLFARLAAEMSFDATGLDRLLKEECPCCGKPHEGMNFRNEVSAKEAEISGLCQRCQDETFRSEDDEDA